MSMSRLLLSKYSWGNWFLTSSILGILLAIIYYIIVFKLQLFDANNYVFPICIILLVLVFTGIFIRERKKYIQRKSAMFKAVEQMIFQEVTAPINSSHMASKAIRQMAEGVRYDLECDKDFNKNICESLRELSCQLNEDNEKASKSLNLVLSLLNKEGVLNIKNDIVSVKKCLVNAVDTYFYTALEKEKITFDFENDIEIFASCPHLTCVFLNIIKIIYLNIPINTNLKIYIKDNELHFIIKSNGDFYERIINNFKKVNFCYWKGILKSIGGNFSCNNLGKDVVISVIFLRRAINYKIKKRAFSD